MARVKWPEDKGFVFVTNFEKVVPSGSNTTEVEGQKYAAPKKPEQSWKLRPQEREDPRK